jgi:hypothetical protein
MKREPGDIDESLVTERLDFPQLLLQSLARAVMLSVGPEREEALGDLEDMLVPWHDASFKVYAKQETNGTGLHARQRLHLRALMLLMQRAGFLGEKDLV